MQHLIEIIVQYTLIPKSLERGLVCDVDVPQPCMICPMEVISSTGCALLCCGWISFQHMMCLGNAELLEHQEDPCNLEHAAGSWKLRTWCYCCCLFPLWTGESVFGVFIKVSQGCRLSVWMLLSQTLHTGDSEHLLSYFYLNLTSSQTFTTFPTSAVERDTAAMLSATNITPNTCPNQMRCYKILAKNNSLVHIRCDGATGCGQALSSSLPLSRTLNKMEKFINIISNTYSNTYSYSNTFLFT